MRTFITRIVSVFSVFSTVLLMGATANAAATWKLDMSVPSMQSSRNFNVQYTILSTEFGSGFEVGLLQNGSSISTQTTPATSFGASGAFAVSVATDGSFNYQVCAENLNDATTKCTSTVSVTVDTTPPNAPTYRGKSRVANQYTISFTAPASSDVKEVRVYSSTQTSFTANASTLVGTVSVTPNQSTGLVYSAGDGAERYHAVQAVDQAGNVSTLTGDAGTTVISTTTVTPALASTNSGAAVLGAQTATPTGVDQPVTAVDNATDSNGQDDSESGEVLGVTTDDKESDSDSGRNIVAVLLIGVPALGILYLLARKYLFNKPSDEL